MNQIQVHISKLCGCFYQSLRCNLEMSLCAVVGEIDGASGDDGEAIAEELTFFGGAP